MNLLNNAYQDRQMLSHVLLLQARRMKWQH